MIRSGGIGRWATRVPAVVAVLALAAGVTACGKSAQSHYEAAERFAAEGRLPEAILEYRNAVAKQPQFADAGGYMHMVAVVHQTRLKGQ